MPATGEAILMTKWLWEAIDKLDGQPKGYYFNQWLNGNADGYNDGVAHGQEWAAIMADTSLSLNDMAQKLEDAGFDVGAAIAAASMGFAARGGKFPTAATSVLQHVQQTGKAPSGYVGGRNFQNDGRGGGQVLPETDSQGSTITYKEFDTKPYQKGLNRGAERIVVGSDGSAYYTSNHYKTFTKMNP